MLNSGYHVKAGINLILSPLLVSQGVIPWKYAKNIAISQQGSWEGAVYNTNFYHEKNLWLQKRHESVTSCEDCTCRYTTNLHSVWKI